MPTEQPVELRCPITAQGQRCILEREHPGKCQWRAIDWTRDLQKDDDRLRSTPVETAVHHPAHYNQGDIEHCELVEDQGHADGYYFGQVTKYLFRAGHKPGADALQDLQKANWYMARWVAWRTHGKKIWKIVRRDPELVFQPAALAEEVKRA